MVDVRIVEVTAQPAAVVHAEVPADELSAVFDQAFRAVMAAIEAAGATVVGPPFGYYPTMPGEVVVVEAGFPTAAPIEPSGEVRAIELPGGTAAVAVHVGPYDTLDETYGAVEAWLADHGRRPAGGMWECYLTDPSAEPDPANWRTEIYCPLAG